MKRYTFLMFSLFGMFDVISQDSDCHVVTKNLASSVLLEYCDRLNKSGQSNKEIVIPAQTRSCLVPQNFTVKEAQSLVESDAFYKGQSIFQDFDLKVDLVHGKQGSITVAMVKKAHFVSKSESSEKRKTFRERHQGPYSSEEIFDYYHQD